LPLCDPPKNVCFDNLIGTNEKNLTSTVVTTRRP